MDKPLSERIREAAVDYGPAGDPEADLLAFADEASALEQRALPDGWRPRHLEHDSGAEAWVQPDEWWYELDEGISEATPIPGVALTDWRGAIAAVEAARENAS